MRLHTCYCFSVNLKKIGMQNWLKLNDWKSKNVGIGKRRLILNLCVSTELLYSHLQERRMHQQREALLKEKETSEKIAARAFAQSYLNDLVPSVFSILHDSGYFYDTTERGNKYPICVCMHIIKITPEIETTFMPWLMEQASDALQKKIIARMMVDGKYSKVLCLF